MAVATLSPWPSATATVALTAARTCLRDALRATTTNLPDDRVDALGMTASAIVERYAATAPQPVKNEAVIRLAGWTKGATSSDIIPSSVGGVDFQWRPSVSRNALRSSGAMGLLSLWHRPRARVIEEST